MSDCMALSEFLYLELNLTDRRGTYSSPKRSLNSLLQAVPLCFVTHVQQLIAKGGDFALPMEVLQAWLLLLVSKPGLTATFG